MGMFRGMKIVVGMLRVWVVRVIFCVWLFVEVVIILCECFLVFSCDSW